MQTNRNSVCISLKRYGHRPSVHNLLSGYFERRRVQEYRGRREKSGGSDPQPPDSGGTNARTRNGKGSGSDPQPPDSGGAGTGIQPHILLAQGAFVQWKSPAWVELQATNLMVRRPPDTLPTTVTRCVRRPSAARPTAAAQPALHNNGNAVRGLRPHQNGIFESTIRQVLHRMATLRPQNRSVRR